MSLCLLAALFLAGCGDDAGQGSNLEVIATTSIWGDVVTQIVGDDAQVEVLIPRGVDAHDFQPTSRQISEIAGADLVIANGLGLEGGLVDVLDASAADGSNVFEVAPKLDPIPFSAHDDLVIDEDHGLDPHVWFDPQRMALATTLIAAELAAIDPSIDWAERARAYVAVLEDTDREIQGLLDTVAQDRRNLVTNHDALGYLADRYEYTVVGVVVPGGSTLGEPSSAELAELVAVIERANVPAIFAESSKPSRLAEAVAAEVGRDVAVVELYTGSLGEPGTPAGTLAGMLVEDAERISGALS